jgi:hypothetical protein
MEFLSSNLHFDLWGLALLIVIMIDDLLLDVCMGVNVWEN